MISPWSYRPVGRRDPRLDWLRGYALFVMIADHVGGPASLLYPITGNTRFYTSAAEAFYFVSGVTLGLISASTDWRSASKRVLSRALVLYRTGTFISLVAAAFGAFTTLEFWGRASFLERQSTFLNFAFRTLTMRDEAGGGGILVLYVLFMLVTPLAFWALARGWAWAVLGVSALLYVASQLVPNLLRTPFAAYFELTAWQVLFFMGLVIGFDRVKMVNWFARVPKLRLRLEWATLILALASVVVFVTGASVWPATPEMLGAREVMRPARLALVLVNLFALHFVVSWLWQPLRAAFGWLFEPLGRSSLWAFTTQYLAIGLIFNIPAFRATSSVWGGAAWQLLAVLLVWGSIGLYQWLMPKVQAKGSSGPA